MSQFSLSIDGELAKLVLHNPPQNRLTQAFFAELGETIAEIGRSGAQAALLSAEGPDSAPRFEGGKVGRKFRIAAAGGMFEEELARGAGEGRQQLDQIARGAFQ